VPALRSSFSVRRKWLWLWLSLAVSTGCATVRAEEKEHLADPAMAFRTGGIAQQHEEHVLENREGSSGAGSARGGGCGCN
jgi:hypothetical protein